MCFPFFFLTVTFFTVISHVSQSYKILFILFKKQFLGQSTHPPPPTPYLSSHRNEKLPLTRIVNIFSFPSLWRKEGLIRFRNVGDQQSLHLCNCPAPAPAGICWLNTWLSGGKVHAPGDGQVQSDQQQGTFWLCLMCLLCVLQSPKGKSKSYFVSSVNSKERSKAKLSLVFLALLSICLPAEKVLVWFCFFSVLIHVIWLHRQHLLLKKRSRHPQLSLWLGKALIQDEVVGN